VQGAKQGELSASLHHTKGRTNAQAQAAQHEAAEIVHATATTSSETSVSI
jgi:hypothetical protein